IVPPMAQLKVLRSLQAELNQRTVEFAKLHPDPGKLSEEERDELKELETAQREVADLFEEIAKLFQADQDEPEMPPQPSEKVKKPIPVNQPGKEKP
ncbi:MAG TPA: hypothetical protein VLM40_23305, partial [Gemmata sp.]|nr:hypothetical protein [Gemmata sp.]